MAGGAKKVGRNEAYCKVYKSTDRERINKRRRLRRHLRRLPNDQCAMKAFLSAGGSEDYLRAKLPNH